MYSFRKNTLKSHLKYQQNKKNTFIFRIQIIEAFKLTIGWSQCIDYHDNDNDKSKRIRFDEEEGEEGEEVRIKVMRTRVYLKAAAEDND